MDDLQVVLKLKKKLKDAVEQEREDDYLLKVLHKLSQVPMTIEILQNTQIGRDVNGLRKLSGTIKTEAKALVQTWKRLLPAAEPDPSSHNHDASTKEGITHASANSTVPASKLGTSSRNHTTNASIVSKTNGSKTNHRVATDTDDRDSTAHSSGQRTKHHGAQHHIEIESAHTRSKPHKSSKTKSKSRTDTGRDKKNSLDDFSKALIGIPEEGSVDYLESDFPPISAKSHRVAHTSKHQDRDLLQPESISKKRSVSPITVSSTTRDVIPIQPAATPMVGGGQVSGRDSPQPNPRKRKADMAWGLDSVALSKRSRTQVYSGKKAVSGPQFVTSLFDLCIKVLIDNIDVMEEVGGIPFYVLEPVLSRCTATQLMRLEEFNPHFIEDSDGLWEKHCRKEFKGAQPKDHQTWRELYIARLENRELKLKSLTARISATEKARQEPIRKVMSIVPTRAPSRRGARRAVPFFPKKSDDPLETSKGKSSLMKQTMKMAQKRNHMLRFKPAH